MYTAQEHEFDEVTAVQAHRPHVVILGAGASLAALPHGDRAGRRLPLMNSLVSTLGLNDILAQSGIKPPYDDFEGIYSRIALDPGLEKVRSTIDSTIRIYFRDMSLPEHPTLYDHLVLGLRKKDLIATFNWDPLLVQAIRRNSEFSESPRVAFLHGNVTLSYCSRCKRETNRIHTCPRCREPLSPAPLLYPVRRKDYQQHPAISDHWARLRQTLEKAYMLTFFGYGAPSSDEEAVRLIREAWGPTASRNLEEIEIIDIQSEKKLRASWAPFSLVHTHHYKIHRSFYASSIANHPRRSCEATWHQMMERWFPVPSSIPREASFDDLRHGLFPESLQKTWRSPVRA